MFKEFIVFDKDEEMDQIFGWAESQKGFSWEYDYDDYPEVNFIVEGSITVTDLETGERFTALPGDVYILDRRVGCETRTGDKCVLSGPPLREAFQEEMIPIPEEWD
jgi:ethanolamine utilization protein EutQ (cupin superfamily)